MGEIKTVADEVYEDGPIANPKHPHKSEIRDLFALIEEYLAAEASKDGTNIYADPNMEFLAQYTGVGGGNLLRAPNTSGSSRYYIYNQTLTTEAVSILTAQFNVVAGVDYSFGGRTSYTTGAPVDRSLAIRFFSDYEGTTLISETQIGEWINDQTGPRAARVRVPDGAVSARFIARKAASGSATRIILSSLLVRRSGSVLPGSLTQRKFNNYQDPEMEDGTLYSSTGAYIASARWPAGSPRDSRNYIYNPIATAEEVSIVSPPSPVFSNRVYEISARTNYASGNPNERDVWVDWFSDYDGTVLLFSERVGYWSTSDGSLKKIMLGAPAGAVSSRFRSIKRAGSTPTQIILSELGIREVPANNQLARYADAAARKTFEINGNIPRGGNFPVSADQEIETMFGGNTTPSAPPLAATDVAEVLFIPPTEEQMNFTGPSVSRFSWYGANQRAIPMDIRTQLYNTPISSPMFLPELTGPDGILTFTPQRSRPIHGVLKGGISMMARASRDNPDARMRFILALRGYRLPSIEMGENAGQRYLASAYPFGDMAKRILDVEAFNDMCAPIDDNLRALMPSSSPNLYVGSDWGYIISTIEGGRHSALITKSPPVTGADVGQEVQTTKWIDISAYNPMDYVYAITFAGTSNRSRIQWRDAAGNIYYYAGQSFDRSSYRLIRLPRQAVAFRIYYTGIGQTAGDNAVDIRAMNGEALDYDPLKGYFHTYDFDVNREVTFWPGGTYLFHLFQQSFAGADAAGADTAEWGFRFLSGGLSLTFDAGGLRRSLANNLYRAV